MESMIERVAKALHEKLCQQDITGYLDAKIDCDELATAAIEEMREPTEEMIISACKATILGEDERGNPVHLEPREARTALEAMIDAALKEHERKPE